MGQVHYIEVILEDDDSNLELDLGGLSLQPEHPIPDCKSTYGGMIASICGVPKYFTLKVKGLVVGQEVMVLIDL